MYFDLIFTCTSWHKIIQRKIKGLHKQTDYKHSCRHLSHLILSSSWSWTLSLIRSVGSNSNTCGNNTENCWATGISHGGGMHTLHSCQWRENVCTNYNVGCDLQQMYANKRTAWTMFIKNKNNRNNKKKKSTTSINSSVDLWVHIFSSFYRFRCTVGKCMTHKLSLYWLCRWKRAYGWRAEVTYNEGLQELYGE